MLHKEMVPSAYRKILHRQLFALSVKELEDRFNGLYASLNHTIASMMLYAQVARHSKKRSQRLTALHLRFKNYWRDLEVTVDAIRSYAALSEYNEQASGRLAYLLREQTKFLQAVTSPEDITPEWIAKRDAFAMLAHNLTDTDSIA